jgi:hypothetical protein
MGDSVDIIPTFLFSCLYRYHIFRSTMLILIFRLNRFVSIHCACYIDIRTFSWRRRSTAGTRSYLLPALSFQYCLPSGTVLDPALSFFQHCLPSRTVLDPALSFFRRCLHSSTVSPPAPSFFQRCLHSSTVSPPAPSFFRRCLHSSTVFLPALSPFQYCVGSSTVSIPAPSSSLSRMHGYTWSSRPFLA